MYTQAAKFCRSIKQKILNEMDLVGILNGRWAFMGPELIQIDLTNACNNDCIACWCRSPMLGNDPSKTAFDKQTLPLDIVRKTLSDCAGMGTTNVYLAGGGEPFMHPHIMTVIEHIKRLGMACHLNTNFTLVDRHRARKLVEIGLDNLIVSLWSATAETYARTHPNKSAATFYQLKEMVGEIVKNKRGKGPYIVLYNVIMTENYHELQSMVDLALELEVDAVEFTVADVIPGKTDQLLLNEAQRQEALTMAHTIQDRVSADGAIGRLQVRICDFIDRLSVSDAVSGDYDADILKRIPCNIGWNFSRILADGNVNGCLKAHRIPVGNIHAASFKSIWNGSKQRQFRLKTQKGDVHDPFFRMIGNDDNASVGCDRGCDDIERNRRIWERLQQLNTADKIILQGLGYLCQIKKTLHRP